MIKNKLTAAIIVILLSVLMGNLALAELDSEGTASGTVFYSGTHEIIPLDKEHFVLKYENFGVRVSDEKSGPFHGMSTHNVGVIYFENGVGKTRGYITYTDKDGDKIIMELNEDAAHMAPKPTKGIAKAMEGTGKFKGIQGDLEYTRWTLRPAAQGTHQSISKGTWNYKIVKE